MMETILAILGNEAVLVALGGLGVYLLNTFLKGAKRKIFDIWAEAILETFEELNLDENEKTAVIYKLLDKLHNAPANTEEAEQVLLDKVKKK